MPGLHEADEAAWRAELRRERREVRFVGESRD